jgi:hypothetical protein
MEGKSPYIFCVFEFSNFKVFVIFNPSEKSAYSAFEHYAEGHGELRRRLASTQASVRTAAPLEGVLANYILQW